jgi:uncharacterized protein
MGNTNRLVVPWGIKDALLFLIAWLVLPSVCLAFLFSFAPVRFEEGNLAFSFSVMVFDSLIGLGLIYLILRKYGEDIKALGLRRFSIWQSVLLTLAALGIFWVAVSAAYWLVDFLIPSFNPDQEQVNEFTQALGSPHGRIISFIALVVIPPLVEEITFRGFIFPAFIKRFGVIGAAVVSSILFGLAHLQFNISVYTLVLGLLLCMMYYKLGSIWPGIALHAINNALAFWTLSN